MKLKHKTSLLVFLCCHVVSIRHNERPRVQARLVHLFHVVLALNLVTSVSLDMRYSLYERVQVDIAVDYSVVLISYTNMER